MSKFKDEISSAIVYLIFEKNQITVLLLKRPSLAFLNTLDSRRAFLLPVMMNSQVLGTDHTQGSAQRKA